MREMGARPRKPLADYMTFWECLVWPFTLGVREAVELLEARRRLEKRMRDGKED
jgi:hypothetical protein